MSKKPPGEPPKGPKKPPSLKLVPKAKQPKSSRAAKDPEDRAARKRARDAAQKEFDRQDRAKAAKDHLEEVKKRQGISGSSDEATRKLVEEGRTRRPAANDPEFQRKPQPKPHQKPPSPAETAEKARQRMIKMESNPKTPPRQYSREGGRRRAESAAEEAVDNMKKGKVTPTPADRAAKTRRIVKGSMDYDRRRFRVDKAKRAAGEVVQGLKQRAKPFEARAASAAQGANKIVEKVAGRAPAVSPSPMHHALVPSADKAAQSSAAYRQRLVSGAIAEAKPGTVESAFRKGVVKTVGKTAGKLALRAAGPVGWALTAKDVYDASKTEGPKKVPRDAARDAELRRRNVSPVQGSARAPRLTETGMAKGGTVKASKAYREFKR